MTKEDEYKRLKAFRLAFDNLDGLLIPMDIIASNINPLREWINHRIKELEDNKE